MKVELNGRRKIWFIIDDFFLGLVKYRLMLIHLTLYLPF